MNYRQKAIIKLNNIENYLIEHDYSYERTNDSDDRLQIEVFDGKRILSIVWFKEYSYGNKDGLLEIYSDNKNIVPDNVLGYVTDTDVCKILDDYKNDDIEDDISINKEGMHIDLNKIYLKIDNKEYKASNILSNLALMLGSKTYR